ncbi:MAG: type 4a pilus biogenesis protein PilO [Deltaproteobacteria bacterium]|jgi:Tfp pilus assembly protein PilO|nr:type 4a pilus biogenesis protein PilO [Deltaproteobacteria bacterium]
MIKQYKIIIIACAVAILCNIAVKYYLISEQNKNIIALQKIIAAARSGSHLKADTGSTSREDISRIMHKIPREFSFTQYAAELRDLIDINDLHVEKTMVFKPEKIKKSDLLKYNTNIVVTGDYRKIKKLIADILNLPGVVYFNSINFTRVKDSQDKVELKFELSLFFKRGTA